MSKHNPIWWQVFISEYFKNGQNGTAAYRVARPHVKEGTAEVSAFRLLRNVNFIEILEAQRTKASEKIEMSRDEWLRLLNEEARFDLRKYLKCESGSGDLQLVEDWQTRSDGHAIEHLKFQTTTLESGQVVQRVEMKAASKLKAQEIIGKALGYLEDGKSEVQGSVELQAQLLQIIYAIKERVATTGKTIDISPEEVQRVAKLKVVD